MRSNPITLFVILCTVFAMYGCAVRSAVTTSTYAEQSLSIDNGSYKIPAILVTPKQKSKKPFPVVVMLHGTASQKNEVGGLYQRLAEYLAEVGIASIRIDFAGTGDSPVDYRFYNLTSAQRDVVSTLDHVTIQQDMDAQRIGLIGFSQGGLIAQLVATKDARIKSLVTWSSVGGNGTGVFQSFFDDYYAEAKANGFAVVKFPWRPEPLNFGLQWFEEVKANSSLHDLKSYRGKLLAIAGTADTLVPYESSINIINYAGTTNAELHLIKGADHMFNVLGSATANGLAEDQSTAETVLSITTYWIDKNL